MNSNPVSQKIIENKQIAKKNCVLHDKTGWLALAIHKRYPTTVWHGRFDLLPFGSGPVPSSLDNLVASDSSKTPHIDATLGADVWSTWHSASQSSRPHTIQQPKPPSSWITGERRFSQLHNSICKRAFKFSIHSMHTTIDQNKLDTLTSIQSSSIPLCSMFFSSLLFSVKLLWCNMTWIMDKKMWVF